MNTKELVAAVATRTGLSPADADAAVRATLDVISAQVAAGDRLALNGFGTFEARDRAARTGRNPQTGKPMQIPAGRTPAFRPARGFRDQVGSVS